MKRDGPLLVLDAPAGAGLYALDEQPSRRSGEAIQGVRRLMADADAPASLAPLISAVRTCNPDGRLRWYPGSPTLILQHLRAQDAYVGCELRPDDHRALQALTNRNSGRLRAQALNADGYAEASAVLARRTRALILVDPPFERADDYARILQLVGQAKARTDVALMIWTPLKDLETFDAFLRGVEACGVGPLTLAQVRLRPLSDPMRLNGCALLLIGGPDVSAEAGEVCAWTAKALGEAGAAGHASPL